MSFGKWLSDKRSEARLTQDELAKRVGVSFSYISALEREEPVGKYGKPRKPTVEVVDKIAKALRSDRDEARIQAGYAPMNMTSNAKPQTLPELIDALSNLGVDGINFFDEDRLRDAPPEEIEKVFDAVRLAVELTLNKYKPDATHTRPEILHR